MASLSQVDSSLQAQELQEKYKLPEYEANRFPLNDKAIDDLTSLGHGPEWQTLEARLKAIRQALPEAAGDLNERLTERKERLQKQRRRLAQDGHLEDDLAQDNELEEFQQTVTRMTEKMEGAMRRAIDGSVNIQRLRSVLRDIQPRPGPPATQSSRRTTQDVTQPGATSGEVLSVTPRFIEQLEAAKDRYEAKSLTERYSRNDDYISWKGTIHQAQYPTDQAPELPDASAWFEAAVDGPAPGMTGNAAVEDDDDDIQISRAKISTKCPITLQEFEEPVQSKKCSHSFEKQAILQLIQQARPDTRHGRSERWVQEVVCPVPGCVQVIAKDDLARNLLLERKIKRIQRMKEAEQDQMMAGDGDTVEQGEEINSDSDSGEDIDTLTQQPSARIKRERLSQSVSRRNHEGDEVEDEDMDDASE